MARITPKVKTSTTELYAVQRKIARLRDQLRDLVEYETELKSTLEPVFSTQPSADTEVVINGTTYVVRYTPVERDIVNMEAVERFYHRQGKAVPKKDCSYSLLRVVKS